MFVRIHKLSLSQQNVTALHSSTTREVSTYHRCEKTLQNKFKKR